MAAPNCSYAVVIASRPLPQGWRRALAWGPEPDTHQPWRLVPSPVSGGGVVLACAPKAAPIYAFKAAPRGPQNRSRCWLEERGARSLRATWLRRFLQGPLLCGEWERPHHPRVEPAPANPMGDRFGMRLSVSILPRVCGGGLHPRDGAAFPIHT